MAISANSIWEVRTAGSDTNGGGFVAGASGTDYSQQDNKNTAGNNISTTDAVANGTTTITSATASFTSAIVGNLVFFTGGSGSIAAQWRQVTSFTNSTTIVIDATIAASTGMTMNIGGALASPGQAAKNLVTGGNIVWVKKGAYTMNSTTVGSGSLFLPNSAASSWELIGYKSSRGDNPTGADRPAFTASGVSSSQMVNSSTGANNIVANVSCDCASLTSMRGINLGGSQSLIYNCEVKNATNGGYNISAGHISRCTATGCANIAAFQGINNPVFSDCIAYSNTGVIGFSAGCAIRCISASNNSGFSSPSAINCVAYNNTADGFVSSFPINWENCISTKNGTWGYRTTANITGLMKNCADWSNTSGRRSVTANYDVFGDINSVVLTGDPFTNAAGNDFTLNNTAGAGAACRAAGFPGTLDLGGTGYPDLGVYQSQVPVAGPHASTF